jgi:hypothetical protein
MLVATLKILGDVLCRTVAKDVPRAVKAMNLAHRLQKHGDCYFWFTATPGNELTNNLAEQAIRLVVIDRHITQGL